MDLCFEGFSKSCPAVPVVKGETNFLLESQLELGASVAQAVFGVFVFNQVEHPYPLHEVFRPLVTCANATVL